MKTFENSNPYNSENIYKNIDSNTEQPTIEPTKEMQELMDFERDVNMQMENERGELEKVIAQLPERNRFKKIAERALIGGMLGISLISATGCGQATRQLDRGFGESVQRCFHDGLTERQQKSYEKEAKRIRDLRTRNINSGKMSTEEAERRYVADMQTLDAAYDSLRKK